MRFSIIFPCWFWKPDILISSVDYFKVDLLAEIKIKYSSALQDRWIEIDTTCTKRLNDQKLNRHVTENIQSKKIEHFCTLGMCNMLNVFIFYVFGGQD